MVPGNHDAYVPGAFDKICRSWGAWMTGDGLAAPADRHAFPYMRVRGKVALIGVSTARATAPFMANGFFREDQSHRLGALLDKAAGHGLFRVVMIHHPPVRNAVGQHKRLFGIGNFQKTVARHGAELVLHGHSHDASLLLDRGQEAHAGARGRSGRRRSVRSAARTRRRNGTCSRFPASRKPGRFA